MKIDFVASRPFYAFWVDCWDFITICLVYMHIKFRTHCCITEKKKDHTNRRNFKWEMYLPQYLAAPFNSLQILWYWWFLLELNFPWFASDQRPSSNFCFFVRTYIFILLSLFSYPFYLSQVLSFSLLSTISL